MYRFSENRRQSPELKKNVFFSIKFNISLSFISKNFLQYIRAISKCLYETVTSEMSPKKY